MELKDAFAAGISPEEFFCEALPALHQARRKDFGDFSSVPVIVSFAFDDTGERYTVELGLESTTVERGEMIDFPIITVAGPSTNWEVAKKQTLRLLEAADAHVEHHRETFHLTRKFVDEFERFDGVIHLEFTGLPGGPLKMRVILNDYEPAPGAPSFSVSIPISLALDVAHGVLEPGPAAKRLRVTGDVGFAMTLGGMLLSYLEP